MVIPVPWMKRLGLVPWSLAVRIQITASGATLAIDTGPGGGFGLAAGAGLFYGPSRSCSAL